MMKKSAIIILCILGLLALIFVGMKLYIPYSELVKVRKNLKFPKNIQNIYYVSSIKIEASIVAYIDQDYYILSESTLQEYTGCDSMFINRPDVILFYGSHIIPEKYYDKQAYNLGEMLDLEAYIQPQDTLMNVPIFKFHYQPKDFVLILFRRFEWICVIKPDVWEAKYFGDYIPAVYPRFTKKQIKQMSRMNNDRIDSLIKINGPYPNIHYAN